MRGRLSDKEAREIKQLIIRFLVLTLGFIIIAVVFPIIQFPIAISYLIVVTALLKLSLKSRD